jgi:hypothetical protein
MSDIVEAVRKILIDNTLVAGEVGTRVYPFSNPLGTTFPAIRYQRVSNTSDHVTDIDGVRIQLTMVSSTSYLHSLLVAAKVRKALNRYKGIVLGVRIKRVGFLNQTDDHDDVAKLFWVNADYYVTFQYQEA